jgi:uncharacterized protein YdcH (DUF465 family)
LRGAREQVRRFVQALPSIAHRLRDRVSHFHSDEARRDAWDAEARGSNAAPARRVAALSPVNRTQKGEVANRVDSGADGCHDQSRRFERMEKIRVESEPGAEVERLRARHDEIEKRLSELERHLSLTPDEQIERSQLKKEKLRAKDRIAWLSSPARRAS